MKQLHKFMRNGGSEEQTTTCVAGSAQTLTSQARLRRWRPPPPPLASHCIYTGYSLEGPSPAHTWGRSTGSLPPCSSTPTATTTYTKNKTQTTLCSRCPFYSEPGISHSMPTSGQITEAECGHTAALMLEWDTASGLNPTSDKRLGLGDDGKNNYHDLL